MKLMIVDDEPYILEGLTQILRGASPCFSQIEEATDVFEALSKMSDFAPDVVITDLNMPEKDGFELIKEAKKAGYCDRFVVLTGYDEFEYARRAIRAGVVEYLLKPIDQDEIVALLRSIAEEMYGQPEAPAACGGHMGKILGYIDRHYDAPLSLDVLAEQTGLHPNYISHLFRKERGVPFIRYLNSVRIEKARELLIREPHTPVHLVGHRVGFESPQYFLKIFKRYVGCTPGSYREQASRSSGKVD
jgi:YesN/AraC family two-component response regulator